MVSVFVSVSVVLLDVGISICAPALLSSSLISSLAASSSESDRYVNLLFGSMTCLYFVVMSFNIAICVLLRLQIEFSDL